MKECKICKIEKNEDDFYKSGKYKGKTFYLNTCKKCTDQARKEYKIMYRALNIEKIRANKNKYYKKRMDDSIIRENVNADQRSRYYRYAHRRLFNNAKARAEKLNLEFNITLDDIIIPQICPILEIPLFTGTRDNYENSPSLDRIDNSLGYVKGNIKVISSLANTMKNSASLENLTNFAKNILKYINNKEIVQTIGK